MAEKDETYVNEDKFTYKPGDLVELEEGEGPTIDEILKRQQADRDPEFGRPDPGFRAPREK